MDSEYDTGSMHSDLSLLEDTSSINEAVLANASISRVTPPFISRVTPPNPAMHVLSSQRRETHNRSPVSFREGRRASDTSLTQGQHSCFLSLILSVNSFQYTMWQNIVPFPFPFSCHVLIWQLMQEKTINA